MHLKDEFVWESPPDPVFGPKNRTDKGWKLVLPEEVEYKLRDKKNKWARIRMYTSMNTAAPIASKMKRNFPLFEFTTRTVREDRVGVYARFTGYRNG